MKKLGFTLAEVLITLVIIGVIAAMTVPSLMQNTNAQEYRSALKKAISAVNQALTLEYALEGLTAGDFSDTTDLVDNLFKKRMNVIDKHSSWATAYWNDETGEKSVKREGCENGATFTTDDGIKYCFTGHYPNKDSDHPGGDLNKYKCNSYNTIPCGDPEKAQLWIDVNGDRKPNMVTTSSQKPRDIYQAQVYSQKVVPFGTPTQEVMFDKEVTTSTSK